MSPKTKPLRLCEQISRRWHQKSRQPHLNPKKEAGNVLNATTTAYAINQKKLERLEVTEEKNTGKCKVCGKEISQQDSEDYDGMCWECWDDQLTEEADSMFDDLM